ncbi:hypothetical protein BDZ97DRAFT_1762813 [Flammula alnicola]|nr:hypothetical protein BDZ97DRAFT_1762813 [Flammula alnicola]
MTPTETRYPTSRHDSRPCLLGIFGMREQGHRQGFDIADPEDRSTSEELRQTPSSGVGGRKPAIRGHHAHEGNNITKGPKSTPENGTAAGEATLEREVSPKSSIESLASSIRI